MRKYSHISVRVPEDILDLFLARVSDLVASSWRRDPVAEETTNGISGGSVRYVFYSRSSGPKTDIVFLYQKNKLELNNVFTTGNGISHTKHAQITSGFWNGGMKQACEAMALTGAYTPTTEVRPEEGLPPGVAEALKRFARYANKSTGSSHPSDMERWCLFLGLMHATGTEMDDANLEAYLTENKFPEDVVMQLLGEREIATTLLATYDHILEVKQAKPVLQ